MNRFVHSLKKNKAGIFLMLLAALQTALGQLFWKISNAEINGFLFAGFLFYFMGALFMVTSFRFGSLSVLHPLLSTGYVLAAIMGTVFLGEILTTKALLGTFLIVVGAVLTGGGDE